MKSAMKEELHANGWHIFRVGECPKKTFDFASLLKKSGKHLGERSLMAEIYFDHTKPALEAPVSAKWLEILKQAEIPFNIKVRREKLKHVYKELADYIKAHETVKKQSEAKV
jgi:hypothetical protein